MLDDATSPELMVGTAMLIGGFVKGCVGIGQPTAALSVMANFLSPVSALAANILPMLATNFIQAREAPSMKQVIWAERFLLSALACGLVAGSFMISIIPPWLLMLAIGAVIVWFAAMELLGLRLVSGITRTQDKDVLVGAIGGVLGGITTLWAPPLILYYSALDLPKSDFIHKSGVVIFLGSIVLVISYLASGVLSQQLLWLSALGVPAAIIGYVAGKLVRDRLNQVQFRKLLLVVFLIGGTSILWRGAAAMLSN